MKKRVIAIDFDDVIVHTMLPFLDYYEREYGVRVGAEHAYSHDFSVWDVEFPEVIRRVEAYHLGEQLQHTELLAGAKDAISELAKYAELHIITGRPQTVADVTRRTVQQHFPDTFKTINFTGIFATTNITKSSVCKELGVNLFIDDHLKHALDVAGSGIETILFGDYPWNQAEVLPETIRRVNHWDDVVRVVGTP